MSESREPVVSDTGPAVRSPAPRAVPYPHAFASPRGRFGSIDAGRPGPELRAPTRGVTVGIRGT